MPAERAAKKKPSDALSPDAVARGRFRLQTQGEIATTFAKLCEMHPEAHCALDHASPFQLLCATVLSAQTTDIAVNKATPALFARYPDAKSLAVADPAKVEGLVGSLGFFRQKTRSLLALAKAIVDTHGGVVPSTMAELVALRGVGRKTANVVLGVAFQAPEGVVVDTHVQRLSQRLGWTRHKDPDKIEQDLCRKIPREHWDRVAHVLIFHGRRICIAARPNCAECGVRELCPSAFRAVERGRKPKVVRR